MFLFLFCFFRNAFLFEKRLFFLSFCDSLWDEEPVQELLIVSEMRAQPLLQQMVQTLTAIQSFDTDLPCLSFSFEGTVCKYIARNSFFFFFSPSMVFSLHFIRKLTGIPDIYAVAVQAHYSPVTPYGISLLSTWASSGSFPAGVSATQHSTKHIVLIQD